MNKSRIEWTDYTWNPIKGLCPVGCWYCYARMMQTRFRADPEIRMSLDEIFVDFPKKPSRIFVCSTFELFHPAADPYRNNVFKQIALTPEHTFIVLTKMPERIDRPMPDNVWLGVSADGAADWHRVQELSKVPARVHFVSLEPFIGESPGFGPPRDFDWLIIGRLTGHGKKHDPNLKSIQRIARRAEALGIPLFLKNNLREIWEGPMIQEFPK